MILLDTNVLVYAAGREHPLREPCRRLLESVAESRTEATTTIEVLQEFLHVRSRSHERDEAARLTGEFADLLSPLVAVSDRDLRAGIRLFQHHPTLDAFDATLAATAIGQGAQALVSADVAFTSIPGLRHVDPRSPALDGLIGP